MQRLLEEYPELAQYTDPAGENFLYKAIDSSAVSSAVCGELIGLLVAKGADVDATNQLTGFTPLEVAAFKKDAAVLALLLDHGAAINHRDHDGLSALNAALKYGPKRNAGLLIAHGLNSTSSTPRYLGTFRNSANSWIGNPRCCACMTKMAGLLFITQQVRVKLRSSECC